MQALRPQVQTVRRLSHTVARIAVLLLKCQVPASANTAEVQLQQVSIHGYSANILLFVTILLTKAFILKKITMLKTIQIIISNFLLLFGTGIFPSPDFCI